MICNRVELKMFSFKRINLDYSYPTLSSFYMDNFRSLLPFDVLISWPWRIWPPTYTKGVQNVFMIFIRSNPTKDFLPRCICYVWVSMNIYSYIELKLRIVVYKKRWRVWYNKYYFGDYAWMGYYTIEWRILKADCKIRETF